MSDFLADPIRIPSYIGDEAFRAFLAKHGCSTSIETIRLRFLGAAVSPGGEADVYILVEDLFENQMPALDGPELLSFLQVFLGLFQEVEKTFRHSPITLSPVGAVVSHKEVKDLLYRRMEEVVFGFLEGVWQDEDDLPLSGTQAAMLTAIEETARTYDVRLYEILRNEEGAATRSVDDLLREIAKIDRSVETTMTSLLEALRNDDTADRPPMRRARNLIEELAFSEELPRDAIRQCVARRDEMVPIFLRILNDRAAGREGIDEHEEALFLIVHILGELGERRAFAPLMDVLAGEPEEVEEVFGDAITENLSQILISLFDGDTERLYGIMNNPNANEYARFAAFDAWTYHVAAGRIDRAEAEQYLSSAFDTLQPREEHLVWVAWLEAIGHLGFTDLREKARNACEIGRIPPLTMLFSEFEEILEAASRSDDLVAFVTEDRLAPFSDTVEVLSRWHSFSEEHSRAETRAEREPVRPIQPFHTVTNPMRSVGRNDPCPCGSGKKFKKCCLQ